MKYIKPLLIGLTVYLFAYAMMPHLGASYQFMYFLFITGNLLLVYAVYAVLKFGEAPKRKFSDGYWYADIDKKYASE